MADRIVFLIIIFFATPINAEENVPLIRWYSNELVQKGEIIFRSNCATCHGDQAQGLYKDWQETLPDGNLPPPPLNGSAHAWHHPISVLAHYIYNGGKKYGGVMPGFKGKISQTEAASTIAYFQSFWSDELYQIWLDNGGMDVELSPKNKKQ